MSAYSIVRNTSVVRTLQQKLGRRIALLRTRVGITQEMLAERTSYSVDFIGLIERGVNAPTLARLKDIADALSVEVWHLFCPEVMLPKDKSGKK
ncbi:helix-turn-helix domain-containing protein [Edaphobacter bradus]|uniref:helix-turn-helix domain-containing protein n=1 Tax=Edaphobacter bradus TaxID=2259016 RepID=UPI0037C09A00